MSDVLTDEQPADGGRMMDSKRVVYYCSACKRSVIRIVTRAAKTRRSFCERTGKNVEMRLLKGDRHE